MLFANMMYIQVTVSLMTRRPNGSFTKDGTPVEFSVDRYSSYSDLMSRASVALELPPTGKNIKRSLFTSGGAIIQENCDWSLDVYMKQVRKGSIKIGVGDIKVSVICCEVTLAC